jgi:hypothetical protein
VEVQSELDLAREVVLGDGVHVIGRCGGRQRGQGLAALFDEALVPLRAVVAEPVVVLGAADVRRERRFELGEGVDPRICDLVDLRGCAGFVSHGSEPRDETRCRQTGLRVSSPPPARAQ